MSNNLPVKGIMETQDDSIDIPLLQRVALGREPAQSQSLIPGSELLKIIPHHNVVEEHYSQISNGCQLSTGQEVSQKSLSNRHESPIQEQNARSLTNAARLPFKQRRQDPAAGLHPSKKMSSADTVPSDTQVISQSVYDDLIRQNQEAADNGSDSNLADNATLRTLHEGDIGHVDLLAGFDGSNTDATNGEDNEDQSSFKLGESSPMHYQPNLFPESQRFVSKTPATTVKTGRVDGFATVTPTASRNPLATELESSGGIMALSQVFKATQAPSSPIVRGQQSDPMSDRPSPNLPIQNRSLATTLSSPLNNIAATFPRDSSEPHLNYITMQESQAQRDIILRERMTRSADYIYSGDQSDGEFDKEPSFVERIRRQRNIDEETREQLAGLSAPPRAAGHKNSDETSKSPSRIEHQGNAAAGATSEEETEQEDELCQRMCRSPDPNPSNEEDKENHNDPSTTPLAAATSAHDRLSQALALDGAPSPSCRSSLQGAAEFHLPHGAADEQPDGASSSSQVYIVKDSQRSPELGDKAPTSDIKEKSSSMPSRVAETPVQRPKTFADVVPTTAIPETSPNRFFTQSWANDVNNESMDQEDDDLPPLYSSTHERGYHSQPVNSNSSSPVKSIYNSKILSSPSGRQRRALTEIAADASPQIGTGNFDVDINILSADDREFRSAVALSPVPPRKRRRGNDGQNVFASDPVLPITPRAATYFAPLKENETMPARDPKPEQSVTKPKEAFEKRSRASRRAETVWDVDDSPHYHFSRKERARLFGLPRILEQKAKEAHHSEESTDAQLVADQNCSEATSLPTEQHVEASRDEPSEDLIENSTARGDSVPDGDVAIALNQVLAAWSGTKRAFYPATCFGRPLGTSQSRYLVKFEDSAPVEVPIGAVKRLELRVGDAVKVDMPNVPKVTHIIRGFEDKLSMEDLENEASNGIIRMTDVYGHSTVVLGQKQRKSLTREGLAVPENSVKVPISRIYLDTILWNQLKDRTYSYSSVHAQSENRLQTPSDRHTTPASPSTRLSRSIRYSNGIFAGMVFAVSYGENDEAKTRITRMILDNDGRILHDGFNELFDLPSSRPVVTPSKSPTPAANNNNQFRLTGGAEDVGFACLIADKHSRRPKYMQALALNLPCLSDRWIEDCVAQRQVIDWEMYLLPAGESSYLHGATKSRLLHPYPATQARLPETIAARPNLLHGQSVLVVMGRGKADEERRKAYLFLTYALGASKVERVPDVKSARGVLDQGATGTGCEWDWIYVDNDEKASAIATILGASVPGSQKAYPAQRSRKRKRNGLTESISGSDLGLSTNVRIVGNEFVCQSLILGRLID
ncbi:hypothetical protein BDV35DRAFT_382811 [Aspergillus flavus]|uniref:BRCT domain-containing protein n=1 Tax=Aspergillus flavus TaxID=5059 RepID=A0A5N6GN84_ASPFL|nr:hypothetical protein BDV35DRAFT_382811 [Aspergillus flavus]